MAFNCPDAQASVKDVIPLCTIRRYQKKRKAVLIASRALEEEEEQQQRKRRAPLLPRIRSTWGLQEADLPEFRRHFRMSRLLFERLRGKVLLSVLYVFTLFISRWR